MVLEDQARADRPGVIDGDIEPGNTIVGVYRRQSVAVVIVLVDPVTEIIEVAEDAVMLVELVVDTRIQAVVVVLARRIGEEIIAVALA
jgi:hypothetical protein